MAILGSGCSVAVARWRLLGSGCSVAVARWRLLDGVPNRKRHGVHSTVRIYLPFSLAHPGVEHPRFLKVHVSPTFLGFAGFRFGILFQGDRYCPGFYWFPRIRNVDGDPPLPFFGFARFGMLPNAERMLTKKGFDTV